MEDKKIRLDKWLHAARFYKTRSIARDMIEGGKVTYNGNKAKVSKTVEIGAIIRMTLGNHKREVEVLDLSDVRGPYSVAKNLYKETQWSLDEREKEQKIKDFAPTIEFNKNKPNKKERREILSLYENNGY